MSEEPSQLVRRRIRRLTEVSADIRKLLASGTVETASWTEWMATDMPALAHSTATAISNPAVKSALIAAAGKAKGRGILARLAIFGAEVSAVVADLADSSFLEISAHPSDVVRQWAVYAVNHRDRSLTLAQRLARTLPFASDHHMSVRECAWMAFRPHLITDLSEGLRLLEPISRSEEPNLRRFSIEVTRPRSVWGAHIAALKDDPGKAIALLDNVYQDSSRYVRLSAGNWLNDASKTRPDWVREVCSRWSKNADKHTDAIIRRGLRTLERDGHLRRDDALAIPERRSACHHA